MSPDPIILALEQQVGCYQRLAKLAEIQHDHVQQGQTEALLAVLQQRQDVLEQLTALERTIAPAKRQWAEYGAKLDAAGRAKAEALLGETRRLLERITSADRDDVMVLENRKLNIGRQLGKATVAKQVNRSYAAAAYGARRPQMDLKQ